MGALGSVRTFSTVRRLIPVLAAACVAAGCGAAPPVPIPSANPSPSSSPTTIAPGVQVPPADVRTPAYTVSTTHPLPSGVSAATVAQDVVIDNLIENIAIERGDPALLAYADCGNWLAAEQQEISRDQTSAVKVLSVTDRLNGVSVGYQSDPANSTVVAAAVVTGVETRTTKPTGSPEKTSQTPFRAILWFAWSASAGRYLICDAGN